MKKILKLVFSKKVLGALLLIAQIVLVAATADKLYSFRIFVYGGTTILSIILILYEVNRDVSSSFKIIWIALIAIVPFFGILLYLYVHFDIFNYNIKMRIGAIDYVSKNDTFKVTDGIIKVKSEEKSEAGIFEYLNKTANAPCYDFSNATYFEIGEKMYKSLIEDVKEAKKYIFIEFFIINESSYMWKNLFDILKKKVVEGVDVRIIYDGMGSLTCTSSDFVKSINDAGIKCCIFSPVKPFLSSYHNNRDHRKIIVIDGKCAYTGGVNLADEYINRKSRFGHWKDCAARVSGEAVEGFVLMFLKMWAFVSHTNEENQKFISEVVSDFDTDGYIAPFEETPVDNEYIFESIYSYIINTAKDYIYISTPYLVLDDKLSESLRFASKRGVDVRILMPHIPDKWYAFAVARTYYPKLIESGVKIYEYTPGFVHGKSTISDGKRAVIGSANYDFRSLYLHYECGMYIYKNRIIDDMYSDFTDSIGKSKEFTIEEYKRLNIFYRLAGRVIRFFAPLL